MEAYTTCYTIKGVPFTVSNSDLQFVAAHRWSIGRGYVRRTTDGAYLHNLLVQPEQGMVTDHINRDRLDNRRSNLRVCTRHQNLLNAGRRSDNTSGYRGVSQTTGRDTFEYNIYFKGKRSRKCGFPSALAAHEAYLLKAKELFGEFAPSS